MSELLNETNHTYDFGNIDDMDPSLGIITINITMTSITNIILLADGFRVVYERDVPVEVRLSVSYDNGGIKQGTLETIKMKMLLLGSDENPAAVRLELSSEADLFFHFMHIIDETSYKSMQESQKLMVEFSEYPSVLVRMLNSCIREPHVHLGIFVVTGETSARLDFIQNMEYKFVELMSCNLIRSPDEIVQHQITFRYNSMKQRLAIMQSRLHEINTLVKTKNPSLLLQLQKTAINNTNVLNTSTSDKRR